MCLLKHHHKLSAAMRCAGPPKVGKLVSKVMVVRIRITRGPWVNEVASGLAGLLTLVSVACFSLSTWKVLSDLGWAGGFFIMTGVLSHWQVWMAATVVSQLLSFRLSRRVPPPRALIN
jgi:hypothetical protein